MSPYERIKSRAQVTAAIRLAKEQGNRVGFTCGAFDILHAGHVDYLAQAKENCDMLIVAVNSDASILRYKGHLPIIPEMQRMFMLAGLRSVSYVTLMDQDNPKALLELWQPDLYIKGADYTTERLREDWGGAILTLASKFQTSSSAIKARIKTA